MNYLISKWGFTCISGCEVDDAVRLCYERTPNGEQSIIVSADKDLLQIPGKHFIMGVTRKGEIKREDRIIIQDEFAAEYKFYEQMLTGDIVDNVKALYGIGPKKAAKILANATTAYELRQAVADEYKKAYELRWMDPFTINETLLRVDASYADDVGFERPAPVPYVFYKEKNEY
jgi:5'-3' exonuclease